MCGIVGMVLKHNTGLTKQTEDVFDQLLYVNTLRGEDSTGIIAVEKDTTFHIAKDASAAHWFTPMYKETKVSKDMWNKGKAVIGHNRKKTVGKIEDASAHPFVVNDEFAMVHNGTLYNHNALAKTDVDSEALSIVLAEAFKEEDYKEAVEETLGKVSGAYAVAMYDQRHNKVRLLRNKERPLCLVETTSAWYFASEAGMLYWILGRNGALSKDSKVELIPEHTLIEFDLDKSTESREELVPKKPLPPTKSTAGTGAKTTGMHSKTIFPKKQEGLSKNMFKRFRNRILQTKIEWWCEDLVEVNFPKLEADGETLFFVMGVNDDLSVPHIVRAEVDYKALGFTEADDMLNQLWSGVVNDVTYDKRAKQMTISLENAQPLPISHRSQLPVIDAEYIKRKLDDEEKAKSTLH
jgi:glucosamine 6-phosphate synthetase-like amidotransferase/phosphosugar isomerase protein